MDGDPKAGAVVFVCIAILVAMCYWLAQLCLRLLWLRMKQLRMSSVVNLVMPRSRRRSRRSLSSLIVGQESRGLHVLVAIIGLTFIKPGQWLGSNPSTSVSNPSQQHLSGRVTHVRDGDTIEVSGVPIRFARLDCAELGTPAGRSAKQRMTVLTRGKRAECTLTGRRSYDRQIGECTVDRQSLSSVMVRDGYCTWWR